MFLLVPAHPGCSGQNPESCKTVIVVVAVSSSSSSSSSKVYVNLYSTSSPEPLMRSRDHLSYGITQCYLTPSRGDSPNYPGFHQYPFYHPVKGGRLSQPRHCSKGTQPVPKAVYRSGCDKHKAALGFDPGT